MSANAEAPAPPPPGIRTIAPAIPTLRNAVALGTLVAIDSKADLAEFRIGCGWYINPKRKTRIGLWRVALRGLSFEWETYPAGAASGISHPFTLKRWERWAESDGWSGTLYLSRRDGFLTNGPTTDICAGILG